MKQVWYCTRREHLKLLSDQRPWLSSRKNKAKEYSLTPMKIGLSRTVVNVLNRKCTKCIKVQSHFPNQGSEETIRVVSMDKDYHVECYHCEVSLQHLCTAPMLQLHW